MTQHSSGTWIARGNTVFTEGDWALSIAVATNLGRLRKAEMNANAQLIAAAPDMAEALPALIECAEILAAQCRVSGDDGHARMYQARAEAGRAATAKATGQ